KNHGGFRNVTSTILQKLIKVGIPQLHNDYSAFRLIRRDIAKACVNMQNSYTFLDGYLSWVTCSFSSVKVKHQKRLAGESSYTLSKLINHSINIFVTFSDLPIKLVSYFSLVFFLLALLYSGWIFIQKIVFDNLVPGFATTIILISLGFSAVLFALGIIGQYIHRINLKTTKHPNYLISKTI
ncbi:MAG: hypothetical protein MI866_02680, partial [Bacteroidales bacterium]|nr:hypothetical protein [Bacteroidales bacterium]